MNSGINNRLPTPLKKKLEKASCMILTMLHIPKFSQSLAFLLSYFEKPKDGDMYVGKETNIASSSSHEW